MTVSYTDVQGNKREIMARPGPEGYFLSARELVEALAGSCFWDSTKGKLMAHVGDADIIFTANTPYVLRNDSLFNLTFSMKAEAGVLWLPLLPALDLLSPLFASGLFFDEEKKAICRKETENLIRRYQCEEKKNGTLYTLYLPDSMLFDATFFPPQLNLNIFKGRLSVSELERMELKGLIKKVTAVQFADNAQVALVVDSRADKPTAVYRSNPPRIEVSITEKEVSQPIQQERSFPIAEAPKAPLTDKGLHVRTVILDPGHGGEDPGATNSAQKAVEKAIALTIGLKAKERLKRRFPALNVLMTRDKDEFIPLKDRKEMANRKKGNLFISIHLNAIPGSLAKRASVEGYAVYFLDVARDDDARAAAALENSVIKYEKEGAEDEGINDVDFILKSTELNLYRNESEEFAILLEKEMDKKLGKVKRHNTGVSQAGFYVLRGPEMPAVLIESGFISHPREAGFMKTESFQDNLAESICSAVEKFKQKYDGAQP